MAEETTPVQTGNEPNKLMGVLSYCGILLLIPLLAVKIEDRDDYLRTHLRQGLGLFLLCLVAGILGNFGTIGGLIAMVLYLVIFIFWILGVVHAVKPNTDKLPIFGEMFDKSFTFIK